MAKYRHIYTEFWEDPKVVEEFTPEDKLFYLYLLTNPKTTQIGIYQITKKQMAFELGYSAETINSLMQRFITMHGIIEYNGESRELCIKNWGKYNLARGGKPMYDLIKKELKVVKDKRFVGMVSSSIENEEIKKIFDSYASGGEIYFEPSKTHKPSLEGRIKADEYVIWRDKQTCFYTGLVLKKGDYQIDHIVPKSKGGQGTPENLVVSYSKFNNFKSLENDLKNVISRWNITNPGIPINYESIKRKLEELNNFEKKRWENQISYREAIENDIRDEFTLRNYIFTLRGQKEKEKEKHKEKQKENEKEKNVVGVIFDKFSELGFGAINSYTAEQIDEHLKFFEPELIIKALEISSDNNALKLSYVNAILRNWKQRNIFTMKNVEAAERQREAEFMNNGSRYSKVNNREEQKPKWLTEQENNSSEKNNESQEPLKTLADDEGFREMINNFRSSGNEDHVESETR